MAQIEDFGQTPDGATVQQITLRGGGLTAYLLTYGATLRDLRLDGHAPPLVLGFDRFAPYISHPGYFGATVGRCANRIAGGRFSLDGTTYQLDINNGPNHLHGGAEGISQQLWQVAALAENSATLTLTAPDGAAGYPGALHIRLTLSLLPGGVMDMVIEGKADAPTLCNIAHHSYFNLGAADILSHKLQIAAEHYLPVDATLIPTGAVAPTAGSGFDFRAPRGLGDALRGIALDHNFCLSHARQPIRPVARLFTDEVALQIATTEPGLQIYDAASMDVPIAGLNGPLGAYAGLAMEPQLWPDAINHPDWAQPVLRPGGTYRQHSQFTFARQEVA
jgi:aldose 1-epimerase